MFLALSHVTEQSCQSSAGGDILHLLKENCLYVHMHCKYLELIHGSILISRFCCLATSLQSRQRNKGKDSSHIWYTHCTMYMYTHLCSSPLLWLLHFFIFVIFLHFHSFIYHILQNIIQQPGVVSRSRILVSHLHAILLYFLKLQHKLLHIARPAGKATKLQ